MKKSFIIFAGALAAMPLAMFALDDYNFEFLNKLPIPIEYAIGTRKNPPSINKMRTIWSNEKAERFVNTLRTPQMLFREKDKPDMAILYEFPDTVEKIHIKIELTKDGGYKIMPQTTLGFSRGGNVTQDDIKVIGSRGILQKHDRPPQPKPAAVVNEYDILGLREDANDAEILGLTPMQLKDKNAVKKAFRKLALIWHPDKINSNDIAKARYAKADVQKLPATEQEALKSDVFALIEGAYSRNK